MSNEPFFKIFIDVFLKRQKFIMQQVIDGVQMEVTLLPPNESHNHMADVQVMRLHFSFQKILL
jgi:hypothetical protein